MFDGPDDAFFTEVFDGDGISPRPRQTARISGVPGGADYSAGLDRADRPVVPLGGIVRDGDTPVDRRCADTPGHSIRHQRASKAAGEERRRAGCLHEAAAERSSACSSQGSDAEGSLASGRDDNDDEQDDEGDVSYSAHRPGGTGATTDKPSSKEVVRAGRTHGAIARLSASRVARRNTARERAAQASVMRLFTDRATSRPARAAMAQQAAAARSAAGGPPVVVGPASVDRLIASRDVAGAEDRPLLRRRLGDRSSAGNAAADASTRLLQILNSTTGALQRGGRTAEAIERSLGDLGDAAGRVAISATVRRQYPQYLTWMSTFHRTMTQLLGDDALPDLRAPIDVRPSKPIHGGVLAIWLMMIACDLVPRRGMAANGEARGGAPHSKVDGLADKAYSYNYARCLLDGTSGWSRAHGMVPPQHDPRWAETVNRARRLAKRMLDTGRSFRAEALTPLSQVRRGGRGVCAALPRGEAQLVHRARAACLTCAGRARPCCPFFADGPHRDKLAPGRQRRPVRRPGAMRNLVFPAHVGVVASGSRGARFRRRRCRVLALALRGQQGR